MSLRIQVQDAHLHLRRRVPLRPGPLLLRARRVGAAAAAGAVVAARVQDEALPLRHLGVPLLRRRPLPVRAHGPRAGVPWRGTRYRRDARRTRTGRGVPVRAAAAVEDAGQEVQDAHVSLRRGHASLRRGLLLRAQRRRAPRGKINSSRRRRKSGSARAQEELRPLEPDEPPGEPPGEPTDVVSRLERLRAIRDSGSVSAAEFEELKQQVLREPGSFATETPALLAPPPPPRRRLSPPLPGAKMPFGP